MTSDSWVVRQQPQRQHQQQVQHYHEQQQVHNQQHHHQHHHHNSNNQQQQQQYVQPHTQPSLSLSSSSSSESRPHWSSYVTHPLLATYGSHLVPFAEAPAANSSDAVTTATPLPSSLVHHFGTDPQYGWVQGDAAGDLVPSQHQQQHQQQQQQQQQQHQHQHQQQQQQQPSRISPDELHVLTGEIKTMRKALSDLQAVVARMARDMQQQAATVQDLVHHRRHCPACNPQPLPVPVPVHVHVPMPGAAPPPAGSSSDTAARHEIPASAPHPSVMSQAHRSKQQQQRQQQQRQQQQRKPGGGSGLALTIDASTRTASRSTPSFAAGPSSASSSASPFTPPSARSPHSASASAFTPASAVSAVPAVSAHTAGESFSTLLAAASASEQVSAQVSAQASTQVPVSTTSSPRPRLLPRPSQSDTATTAAAASSPTLAASVVPSGSGWSDLPTPSAATYGAMLAMNLGVPLTAVTESLSASQKKYLVARIPNAMSASAVELIAIKIQGSFPHLIQTSVLAIQRRLMPMVGRGRKSVPEPVVSEEVQGQMREELRVLQQMRAARYTHMRCTEHLQEWIESSPLVQRWTVMEIIQAYASLVNRILRWIYKRKLSSEVPGGGSGNSSGSGSSGGSGDGDGACDDGDSGGDAGGGECGHIDMDGKESAGAGNGATQGPHTFVLRQIQRKLSGSESLAKRFRSDAAECDD